MVYPFVHRYYSNFNPCPWCWSHWRRGLRAWVCGRSFVGITASNPAGGLDACILWVLCVVTYRSLRRADHSPKEILPSVVCVTECDREASTMKRPWPSTHCRATKINPPKKTMPPCPNLTWSAYMFSQSSSITIFLTDPRCHLLRSQSPAVILLVLRAICR